MKHIVQHGITDYTVLVMMRDDAGAPATALAHTDIDIAYARVETDNDVTTSDVTPADLASLTAAHSDWGWEVVSATDHPGVYRLDIADAVFAAGAWSAVVSITGTGLDPAHLEFQLVPWNPNDSVRLGLTALPNAAADAAGGLPISDAGGLDLDAQRSDVAAILVDTGTTLQGEVDGIQADTEDIQSRLPAALVGGRMDSNVQAMANAVITSLVFAAGAIDASAIAADAIGSSELAATAATEIANAVGALVAESNGSITVLQALSYILAAVIGVTADSGATFKDPSGTSTRAAVTYDASQNRLTVTLS